MNETMQTLIESFFSIYFWVFMAILIICSGMNVADWKKIESSKQTQIDKGNYHGAKVSISTLIGWVLWFMSWSYLN